MSCLYNNSRRIRIRRGGKWSRTNQENKANGNGGGCGVLEGELVKESYQFRSPGHKGKPCRNAADVSHSNAAGIKKYLERYYDEVGVP